MSKRTKKKDTAAVAEKQTDAQLSGLRQVNLRILPDEDRLLFSINTTSGDQFRLFLTRRWVKQLWPQLNRILDAEMQGTEVDDAARDAAKAFQHQESIGDANYDAPFDMEGMNFPWGEYPKLATEVRYREPENALPVLGIYTSEGLGLEFNCGHKVLHYLYDVLPMAVERAEWDLMLKRDNFVAFPEGSNRLN